MTNKNDNLVIAYYIDRAAAEAAVDDLKDWDKANDSIKLGAIAVLTLNENTGHLEAHEVGQRDTKKGALWGAGVGVVAGILTAGIGLIPGIILGTAAGGGLVALNHKSVGMSDADREEMANNLKNGGAALAVMADGFEVEATEAELQRLGGRTSHYNMPEETVTIIEETVTIIEEAAEAQDSTVVAIDELVGQADIVAQPVSPERGREGHLRRYVTVDFSSKTHPLVPLDRYIPLEPRRSYYFYLEIGEEPGGIDEKPVVLPDLPIDAELDVVVFGYPNGIQVQSETHIGRVQLRSDGTVHVTDPVEVPSTLIDSSLIHKRLFFSIVTPAEPGDYHLRCLVYYEQALVQARIITALVATTPSTKKTPVIRSRVDYTLSQSLAPSKLAQMSRTRLSLFINDNDDGTHTLAVKGSNLPPKSVHLSEGNVKDRIKVIRGSMREATWGDSGSFSSDKKRKYRYKSLPNLNTLQEDLVRLAFSGWQLYEYIALNLGDDYAEKLHQLLRETSELQFSAVESVTSIVPVAAIYDHPLDRSYDSDLKHYALCEAFKDSFVQHDPLDDTDCFRGNCPSRHDDRTVCPSGFWGYRHRLGLPVSVGRASPEATMVIPSTTPIQVSVAVSTANDLVRRVDHQTALSQISSSDTEVSWDYHDSHDKTIEMLRQKNSQIFYFYCHAGFDTKSSSPYLSLGPKNGPRLYPDILKAKKIQWEMPPLVFINGCYTTALDPEKAMNFVDRLIQYSRAAGVIGTEIAVFESTAVMFAQEFFKRFLLQKQTAGEAIRGARLDLLQAGSPFGLVYIPFVLPGLRLDNI